MNAGFTPGPWTTNVKRLTDGSICVAHVVSPERTAVAQLATFGESETVANANLIAAAPDMIGLLERLVSRTLEYVGEFAEVEGLECDEEMRALAKEGRALITKARGEQVSA